MNPAIFCLMGPTASGKTDLAIRLAEHFPLEIISVDSAMIYRGMDIGTAKPAPGVLKKTPHHLIDILDPPESWSAASFCKEVERLAAEIFNKSRYPLLVGGTMMYFNALQNGLSELPAVNPNLRKRLEADLAEYGLARLHERLKTCDPETGARIHAHDTQRILRALEIIELSGKAPSVLYTEKKSCLSLPYFNIGLFPENRTLLHERISQRFADMLEKDFVGEVRDLLEKWPLDPSMPSMRSVGYRQVLGFLRGEYDYQTLEERGLAATRQLAKRQLTWLRSWEALWRVDPFQKGYEEKVMERFETLLQGR